MCEAMRVIKKNDKSLRVKIDELKVEPFKLTEFELESIEDLKNYRISGDNFSGNQEGLPEINLITEQIRHEARLSGKEEGYKAGYEEGYNEAFQQFSTEFNLIQKIRDGLQEYKKEMVRKLEPEIVKLSQYIAEKIIRQKINTEQSLILSIISFSVKQISQLGKVIIYLNPEDYEYLKSNKREIEEVINNFDEIKFLEDKRIEKGGCIIETENGNIDTQPTSQLRIMNRILTDRMTTGQ